MGPEGDGSGEAPRGAGGEMCIESVTSALIRASGPAACPLLYCMRCGCCFVSRREWFLRILIPLQPKQKMTALQACACK